MSRSVTVRASLGNLYCNVGRSDGTPEGLRRQQHDLTGPASPSGRNGTGLIRPLEASARAKGVKFLLNYAMTSLLRPASAAGQPGRVIGLTARYTPRFLPGSTTPLQSYRPDGNIACTQPIVRIRAAKAAILATGGNTSNVHFRRMFDPRLTEVYQVGGEPYTFQDASGELAAMSIGASLWGLGNQMLENGATIRAHQAIGARYNYFVWDANSPIFPLVRATGLAVPHWEELILVNQVGQRFYDESKGAPPTAMWVTTSCPIRQGTIAITPASPTIPPTIIT